MSEHSTTPNAGDADLAALFGADPVTDSNDLADLFSDEQASAAEVQPPSLRLGTPPRTKQLRVKAQNPDQVSSGTPVPVDAVVERPAAHYAEQVAESPVVVSQQPRQAPSKQHSGTLSRRFTDGDRLWPIVDKVMAIAGADTRIQQKAAQLQLTGDLDIDAQQRDDLLAVLRNRLGAEGLAIGDPSDIPPVLQMVYDELVGISVLGDLWRDASVTEILVDRWDRVVIERSGRLEVTPIMFRNPEHAASIARSLAQRVSERALSRSLNLVTAELPQARVQFAYGPVVKGGLAIAMRKFSRLLTLEDLRRLGALDLEMEEFLRDAVRARASILVSGGTGTGKTTIINLLSSFIPEGERVVTIEDAFELQLANSHIVSLQTKEASSADDAVSVTLASLLRATLRLRPDRIIVGEIREGEGAEVMLAAANTGHEGTMTTIHANSPDMALNERIVDLVRQVRTSGDDAIRRTVASAFDLVLQVERGRRGNRFISAICQVDRELMAEGLIVPTLIFVGEDDGAGKAKFRRVGDIGPDTALGKRLEDNESSARWMKG